MDIKPGDIVVVNNSYCENIALVEKVTPLTFQGREWGLWGRKGWSERTRRYNRGSVVGIALAEEPQVTADALRHSHDRMTDAKRQVNEQHKARVAKLLKPMSAA